MAEMNLSAIRQSIRQFLKDEFLSTEDYTFKPDELDLHIGKCLREISQVSPYEVRETVVSTGSKEIDISSITDLIGGRVVEAEYPTGESPRRTRSVEVFGSLCWINIDADPTLGENIYLYCHKVHQLTDTSTTLTPDLEGILIDGVVARAALAWLNGMRSQITPNSARWFHQWANERWMIYQAGLASIQKANTWSWAESID